MQKKVSLILSEWMKNELPSWKKELNFLIPWHVSKK